MGCGRLLFRSFRLCAFVALAVNFNLTTRCSADAARRYSNSFATTHLFKATSMPVKTTSTTSLLPVLVWPVVVIVAFLLFKPQIGDLLHGGGFEIQLPGHIVLKVAARDSLPAPPDSIRDVLPALDRDTITNILANYGGASTPETCYDMSPPDEMDPSSAKSKLKKLGLITFEVEDKGPCPAARTRTTYTPKYDALRDYLLTVLTSIKFVPAEAKG